MDEIKKKTFVRKVALEAETAAKRKRKRPKGYLGCILGLTIGIAGLAAARLGHLWVGFDIFSQFTPQFMFLIVAFTLGLFTPYGKVLTAAVLLVVLVAGYSMWPYYSRIHVLTQSRKLRELRVASYNPSKNDRIEE